MGSRSKLVLLLFIITIAFLRYETPNINFVSSLITQNGSTALGHVSSVRETESGSYVTLKFSDSAGHAQTVTTAFFFSDENGNPAKDLLYSSAPLHVHYIGFCPSVLTVDELHSETFYEIACTIIFLALIATIGWSFLIPNTNNTPSSMSI